MSLLAHCIASLKSRWHVPRFSLPGGQANQNLEYEHCVVVEDDPAQSEDELRDAGAV